MIRIVTGTAKGRRLMTLEGEGTRPTTSAAKEAIFSAIQFDVEGRRVLDLFAGCGQLGLEALSRGAVAATFIDAAPEAIAIVKENAKKTELFAQSKFLISDYRSFLRKAAGREPYSLIFIDPPYGDSCVGDAIDRLLRAELAVPGAILVCESGDGDIFAGREELRRRFTVQKSARYGKAYVQILVLLPEEDTP